MTLVTVTYKAWDHNGKVIPAELHPRVGFRPIKTSIFNGLMTDREVWGTLEADGSGTVRLESSPGLFYIPFLEWLKAPSEWSEQAKRRATGRSEWAPILPGNGGDISDLFDLTPYGPIVAALGKPPEGTQGIAWFDLTDSNSQGVMLYAPERAF